MAQSRDFVRKDSDGDKGPTITRALRPRATDEVAPAPLTVTDRTAAALLGLEPRVFRELLASQRIPHARHGRRVIARVDLVLAAIDRMSSANDTSPSATPLEDDDGGLGGVDAILARIGRKRTS